MERADTLRNRAGYVFNIIGHAAHHIAAGVRIQIFDREVIDLVEQIVTHLTRNALTETGRQ